MKLQKCGVNLPSTLGIWVCLRMGVPPCKFMAILKLGKLGLKHEMEWDNQSTVSF